MIPIQVKNAIQFLSNPKYHFERIHEQNFEKSTANHIWLVLSMGTFAALFNLIFYILKSAYLNIFVNIDINYWRMINYSFGRSISIFFFYLFAATFLLFGLSVILKPFMPKIKYEMLLSILFYAFIPLLLFGWIPANPLPFLVWSLFLLFIGLRSYRSVHIKKESILQRD